MRDARPGIRQWFRYTALAGANLAFVAVAGVVVIVAGTAALGWWFRRRLRYALTA